MSQADAIAVLYSGVMNITPETMDAPNLPYNLYSIPFVKPLDVTQLASIIESHSDGLIVMEEYQASCSVGSAIIEQASNLYREGKLTVFPKVIRKAIKDEFIAVVGTQKYLREKAGLSL